MKTLKQLILCALLVACSGLAQASDGHLADKCIVSGEAFGGEMGEPISIEHNGRTIRLCCKSCVRKFKKDPEKYLKLLDEAEKAKK